MRLLIIFIALKLFAFDYFTIKKADEYFQKGQYLKAAKEYLKIDSQKALLNAANSFYKAKNYQKAIQLYKQIIQKNLLFDKYYNMGNAYAYSGNFKKAIEMYKKALKIKNDKDARYNLQILEKLLKKKPPQENKQTKNNKKQKKSKKVQSKNQNKKQKNKKSDKKQNSNNQSSKNNKKNKNSSQPKQQKMQKNNKNNKQPKLQKHGINTEIKPFKSVKKQKDIRLKYYQRKLNQLNFNTLMIPLD